MIVANIVAIIEKWFSRMPHYQSPRPGERETGLNIDQGKTNEKYERE